MWHVQIPGKITTELSVSRSEHQETGGDLEGARIPPGWGDWCRCTVGKHQYPFSLEEGQRSCSLVTYHRHSNTPLGERHWRRKVQKCIVPSSHCACALYLAQILHNVCSFRPIFKICDILCYSEVTRLESTEVGEKLGQNLHIFAPPNVRDTHGSPLICILKLHHILTYWQRSRESEFFGLKDQSAKKIIINK